MKTTAAAESTTFTARKGFESLADETRIESLPVRGTMPPWLQGSLIRTGPARWEVGERSMNHWFDGLAMLHRFSFDDGSVAYANRFLETRAYRAAQDTGRISYSEFATDPCRSLFQRVTTVFSPKISDNANVNLVKLGERFIAMTETPIPVQFDPETLAAAGLPTRRRDRSRPPIPTWIARAAGCSTTPPSSDRAAPTGSSCSGRAMARPR